MYEVYEDENGIVLYLTLNGWFNFCAKLVWFLISPRRAIKYWDKEDWKFRTMFTCKGEPLFIIDGQVFIFLPKSPCLPFDGEHVAKYASRRAKNASDGN